MFENIRTEMHRGQLDAALRESDLSYKAYVNRDPYWSASFLVLKAHVLVLRGSYKDALELLRSDLPPAAAHSDVAVHREMVCGLAYTNLQQYDKADKSLSAAEQLGASIHSSLLPDVAQARGILEIDRKKYPQAAAAFRTALSLARERNLPALEINAIGNLGNVAMKNEHYDEAIEWFRQALQKSQSLNLQGSQQLALGNMGWNYSSVGDFESAEVLLKQAVDVATKAGFAANRVYWLNALGNVYFEQQRYSEAEATSLRALELAHQGDNKNTLTQCLNTLSEIELATGRVDLAEKHNLEAAAIESSGLDHFGVQYSQIISGRIAAGKSQNERAEEIFQKIVADPSAETPLKWQAESRLAQVYAADDRPKDAEQQFQHAIQTIQESQNSLQRDDFRISFLSSAIQFYEAYIDFLVSRGRNLDALAVAELSRTQSLSESFNSSSAARVKASRLDSQSVAARTRSTLLFYSLGEQHSYLWVITPSKTFLFTLPPEDQIAALVKTYRDELTNSPLDPLTQQNSSGSKLYGILVEPAAKLIAPNSRVIILPDAGLNTINFETLVVPSPRPHYWIEDVTLSVANSLSNLAGSRPMPSIRGARLLLVGNPIPADSTFPALPQAPAEIKTVEDYFQPSRRSVLTGSAATASAYYDSDPARFQYIHFVTHGTASRLQPLESAVILSPSGDSYKLYARDIVAHPLEASLVTISACNGAGNRAYAGEGLVGLSWAFLRAGAHNVISALWEVSDASTPQIMGSLYKGLSRGDDPATALRNAKLQLLHSSGVYKKPFYWAPFQLYTGS